MENLKELTIYQLAQLIRKDWGDKVHPAAKPYLQAMIEIINIEDKYGCDSAKSIVLYFLNNAGTWRGETAKAVKAELKRRCK